MDQSVPSRYASLARLQQARQEARGALKAQLAADRKARSGEVSELRDATHKTLAASGKSRRSVSVSARSERLQHLRALAEARGAPVGTGAQAKPIPEQESPRESQPESPTGNQPDS